MAKYHKWTGKEELVLIQCVRNKMSYKDICALLNVSKESLTAKIVKLREQGVELPYYKFSWNKAKEKELVKMIRRNEGNLQSHFRDFAEKYNISVGVVHNRYYDARIPSGRVKDKYPIFGIFGMFRTAKNSKIYTRKDSKGYNFWSIIKTIFS